MSPSTRETVLFWCQVSLYVSAMLLLLGALALAWYFITAQVRTLEEARARDKAMLQQHATELQQHQQSLHHSDQLLQESRQALQDHQRQMERLVR